MRDFYMVLGVQPSSEQEVIDAAYRALMKKYHPDKRTDPGSKRRAQEINEAYQALRDPISRAIYDSSAACRPSGFEAAASANRSSMRQEANTGSPYPASAGIAPREADDGFWVVRWGVVALTIVFAVFLGFCVAMFISGKWVRVPDLTGVGGRIGM